MAQENQPNKSENIFSKPWQSFSAARWQTKLLILGSLGLVIAAA